MADQAVATATRTLVGLDRERGHASSTGHPCGALRAGPARRPARLGDVPAAGQEARTLNAGPEHWVAWHEPYDDPNSPLARRLQCVQEVVAEWLDHRTAGQCRVVSACAGQGRDLLEVLAGRDDVDGLFARLVELEPANVGVARRLASAVPDGVQVDVIEGDAGRLAAYDDAVPADLVLMCGVFGNISDEDVRRTVSTLPMLCATGATVVWTRHRREPDLTPSIRSWFAENDFVEESFIVPDEDNWSVGVHVFGGSTQPLDRDAVMFRFV